VGRGKVRGVGVERGGVWRVGGRKGKQHGGGVEGKEKEGDRRGRRGHKKNCKDPKGNAEAPPKRVIT